jgi:hypothetical protein
VRCVWQFRGSEMIRAMKNNSRHPEQELISKVALSPRISCKDFQDCTKTAHKMPTMPCRGICRIRSDMSDMSSGHDSGTAGSDLSQLRRCVPERHAVLSEVWSSPSISGESAVKCRVSTDVYSRAADLQVMFYHFYHFYPVPYCVICVVILGLLGS